MHDPYKYIYHRFQSYSSPFPTLLSRLVTISRVATRQTLCYRPLRPEVQRELASMHMPLKAATLSQVLAAHPDKGFARYLLAGITEGFWIRFHYGSPLTSSSVNMASAIQHPEVFEEYLSKELSFSCMLGPFPSSMNHPYLQVGINPKGHNTSLITDLSFPPKQSVNAGIDPSLCSLSYITVDQLTLLLLLLALIIM